MSRSLTPGRPLRALPLALLVCGLLAAGCSVAYPSQEYEHGACGGAIEPWSFGASCTESDLMVIPSCTGTVLTCDGLSDFCRDCLAVELFRCFNEDPECQWYYDQWMCCVAYAETEGADPAFECEDPMEAYQVCAGVQVARCGQAARVQACVPSAACTVDGDCPMIGDWYCDTMLGRCQLR